VSKSRSSTKRDFSLISLSYPNGQFLTGSIDEERSDWEDLGIEEKIILSVY
jgi:hypothetical protein